MAANPLHVGLTPAPAPLNTSAVGCVTLLKRDAPAGAGAGPAKGRGRGRRREVVQPDAAIMITTAGAWLISCCCFHVHEFALLRWGGLHCYAVISGCHVDVMQCLLSRGDLTALL